MERHGYDIIDPQLDRRPLRRYLVFVLPFFLQSLLFYALCNFQVLSWEMLISMVVVFEFGYHSFYMWFPPNGGTSPYPYGHVVSAVLFHWAFYAMELYPSLLFVFFPFFGF